MVLKSTNTCHTFLIENHNEFNYKNNNFQKFNDIKF